MKSDMGLSTFIEINNDLADEIGKNPADFVAGLLIYLHTGQIKEMPLGVTRILTVHRDDTTCVKLQKLMTSSQPGPNEKW